MYTFICIYMRSERSQHHRKQHADNVGGRFQNTPYNPIPEENLGLASA